MNVMQTNSDELPAPSIVGDHTKLGSTFYHSNCPPQRKTRGQLRWDGIQVCVRCLEPSDAKSAVIQISLFDHWCWACTDTTRCIERQAENKTRHQREITHRIGRGAGRGARRHTHLVVVQDLFGNLYGYGNFYVAVNPGEDPQEVAGRYSCHEMLVVAVIIPIEASKELK